MWQRFTERARRVILLAQEEAGNLNASQVGTEHLLLGLIREHEGIGAQILQKMGMSLFTIRQEVEALSPRKGKGSAEPKLSPGAKRALELAANEARRLSHNYIGTEHLLLALLHDKASIATKVLNKSGLYLENGRVRVLEYDSPASTEIQTSPSEPRRAHLLTAGSYTITGELQDLLRVAKEEAQGTESPTLGVTHVLLALLERGLSPLPELFEEMGLDAEATCAFIRRRLELAIPPRELREMQEQLLDLHVQRRAAVARDEYEMAAQLREQSSEVEERLRQFKAAWKEEQLKPPASSPPPPGDQQESHNTEPI